MSLVDSFDGYYNDTGYWVKLKHCFAPCSDCTCTPPFGVYYDARYDKRIQGNVDTNENELYNSGT